MPRPRACRCSLRDPKAAYLRDVDGHRYIDCALGYGSVVLGHGHPAVADAMRQAALLGSAAIRRCSIAGMLSLRNVLST
ncbi:aminotransferase class III-fold pyridoxal phosphate-dependent enzyme [Ralstonia pseudosolanacearum]|uniref:aminotransferase class III-fold pyridoxal phosphate-dependent enzyme n=1 Tax=Ralstonia pseudosolanacearum TaxID=1310165 RepID=UPI003394C366